MKADAKSANPLQRSFVLHQRSYTDSRLILELFTEHSGRITVVARRPSKHQSAQFLLFLPQLVAWRGTSDLKTLRVCESAQPKPFSLQGRLHFCGLYLNELLLRLLLPAEAQPRLFPLYEHSLGQLSVVADLKEAEPILRRFELAFLEDFGVAFDYKYDYLTGAAIQAGKHYELHVNGGFAETPAALNPKLGVFDGAHLLAIGERALSSEQVLQTAKHVVRHALAPLLGQKPLKSRELFL